MPAGCPSLPGLRREGSLAACGPGVERVAEEARRCSRGAPRHGLRHRRPRRRGGWCRRSRRAVDLLIGTQIVAKGHHFPHLTLVGVVDADLGLAAATCAPPSAPSSCCTRWPAAPAAPRRRAACCCRPSRPDHPVMQALAAGDRDAFLAAERASRRRRPAALRPPRRAD
jgi:primosomal protein N' (replication factor Y) (superfamily II helicase)